MTVIDLFAGVGGFMTREEIIDGLQYTIDMFCFNPSTGEVTDKNRLNDESRLTVDACEGAIEIIKALEQEPCGNAIDRAEAIKVASGYCHPANVTKELAKLPSVNPQTCGDAIDRKLVCAFIDGLISDDREREKGLEYIRNMPPVNPQPCEDAISRQAVIDLAKKGVLVSNGNYKSVCKAINELPSVNPAKTGHWIGDAIQGEIDGQIVKGFTCSKCGAISVFRMTDGKIINGDLCANCGAKMIESQERSDKG